MTYISPILTDDCIVLQCDEGSINMEDLSRQISEEWLTQALSVRYTGTVVEQATIIRVFAGFSAKIWVEMTFNEAGRRAGLPSVMIVKAGFNRHDPIMLFSYETEMLAYSEFVPNHPINAPACYYTGRSPDGQTAAIIIEDLLPKNVRFCHALTPLTYAEAAAFLDAQAKFHASTWNKPDLLDGTAPFARRATELGVGLESYFQMLTSPEIWVGYTVMPRGAAVPNRLKDRDTFIEAFSRLHKFGETQGKVIVMGDEHLGNLYIEADGKPGFLDFQAAIQPWCRGIAYFLSCALDILDRRRWERDLIAYYLDRLASYGVNAPSFEEGWDAYCRYLLFPYLVWLTNGSSFQKESVNTANTARAAMAMIDNDTYGRLGL
jgi:Ecdysteroid kinase-like family